MEEIMKQKNLVECVLSTFDNMNDVDKHTLVGIVIGYAIRGSNQIKQEESKC